MQDQKLEKLRAILTKLHKHVSYEPDDNELKSGFECGEECDPSCWAEALQNYPEDSFHGSFFGYKTLSPNIENNFNDLKKCVELSDDFCDETIEDYMRAGICCFVLDFSLQTYHENKLRILNLRKIEERVGEQIGFNVTTTIVARLSPRLQYIGNIRSNKFELKQGDNITISTNRYWANRGNKKCVYVNARYMLPKLKQCDIILIGQNVQVQITVIDDLDLHCTVQKGGEVTSRMPTRFPGRCQFFHLSVEELEDILLAKYMSIKILVSYSYGSRAYFDDLRDCLLLLNSPNSQIFTRMVWNEASNCDKVLDWICDCYDGICVEVQIQHPERSSELLTVCPGAESIIERFFQMKKPILFDPNGIAQRRILVQPDNYYHVFFCPEKYIFNCSSLRQSFHFFCLQNINFNRIPKSEYSEFPFLAYTCSESDKLAFNVVATSYEQKPKLIFVSSTNGKIATKIAHFRPSIPIILLTKIRCVGYYVSVCHNVVMLWCKADENDTYEQMISKQFIYGLKYARRMKMLCNSNQVLLVFGQTEISNKMLDKYVLYKFDEEKYAKQIETIICSKETQISV